MGQAHQMVIRRNKMRLRHSETTRMGAVMNGTTIAGKDMAITTKEAVVDLDGARGEAVAAGDIKRVFMLLL